MRLSRYFLPILRENPKEAEIVSHRLMLRAGMVRQEAAGIYAWLPLGFRVLENVTQIVREEMDRAGAIELLMPTLQLADLWRETGRYDAYGPEMLRIKDRHERELLYGPTNEDMITEIFRASVRSYRDLPKNLYHIQWKFRDEQRPRFGVMRGREFLMKDAYSFDIDEAAARRSYQRMFVTYLRIFARMGLKAIPMRAETGPIGGDQSHEFIILADTGESGVFINSDVLDLPIPTADVDYDSDLTPIIDQWTSLYAATDDVHDAARFERETPADKRLQKRGIEVGQVFYFGDKYSKPMKAVVTGPDGVERPVLGGSYGVGVSRLVGALIEAGHDEAGIIWPESVAPFRIGIANLKVGDAATDAASLKIYDALQKAGIDVLYDDTDERPGGKFARLDLIGLPYQIIIGPKGLAEGQVEVKTRSTGIRENLSLEAVISGLPAEPREG
ncbi:MAG: proline--tRNA ligase [Methylovirgula sp.]